VTHRPCPPPAGHIVFFKSTRRIQKFTMYQAINANVSPLRGIIFSDHSELVRGQLLKVKSAGGVAQAVRAPV
jgi:hypothetical protein